MAAERRQVERNFNESPRHDRATRRRKRCDRMATCNRGESKLAIRCAPSVTRRSKSRHAAAQRQQPPPSCSLPRCRIAVCGDQRARARTRSSRRRTRLQHQPQRELAPAPARRRRRRRRRPQRRRRKNFMRTRCRSLITAAAGRTRNEQKQRQRAANEWRATSVEQAASGSHFARRSHSVASTAVTSLARLDAASSQACSQSSRSIYSPLHAAQFRSHS